MSNDRYVRECEVLDPAGTLGHSVGPNQDRRTPRLCPAQQDDNSGFLCFCRLSAFERVHKLAEQRPGVREAPAACLEPGSVVSAFVFFKPQNQEVYHV